MSASGGSAHTISLNGTAVAGMITITLGWLQRILTVAVGAFCVKFFLTVIYNLYFHPLRNFPGPKLAAATPIPFAWRLLNGRMVAWHKAMHAKYGTVVRNHPDELSFIGASGWKDIYAARPELPKPIIGQVQTPSRVPSIVTIPDPQNHGRQRKILGPAFSEHALREQEYILQKYSDLLISRLREQGGEVDIIEWYNYTTFDVTGDLCFAESFRCLEAGDNHPWVAAVYRGVKFAQILTVFDYFPPMDAVVKWCIPPSVREKARESFIYTRKRIDQRIALKSDRPDFMKYILENNHEGGMTREEINSTVTLLVLAGSETSATTLTSATYYSLNHPRVFERLKKEIRDAFDPDPSSVTISAVSELPYLNAVITEALRLHPNSPVSVPRQVDRPVEICGVMVPPGVRAGMSGLPTFTSPINFVDSMSYIPERWLEDADPRFAQDKKDAFAPFLVGPRNCLGKPLAWAEMKLILAKVILNFDLELSNKNIGAWDDTRVWLLHEKKPFYIKIHPRRPGKK